MLVLKMLEIDILEDDNFLKIRETLKRMGIANNLEHKLYQSCHILHKRGKYYVVHFKELLALDGRETSMDEEDIQRRNNIAKLLEDWNLCKIVNPSEFIFTDENHFRILSHSESGEWELIPKYFMGTRHPKKY